MKQDLCSELLITIYFQRTMKNKPAALAHCIFRHNATALRRVRMAEDQSLIELDVTETVLKHIGLTEYRMRGPFFSAQRQIVLCTLAPIAVPFVFGYCFFLCPPFSLFCHACSAIYRVLLSRPEQHRRYFH